MSLLDLIPTQLFLPVMVGLFIAIVVISYKVGILGILVKIIAFPFQLIFKILGLSKDAVSSANYNLKSSGSLLGDFKSALDRGEKEKAGEQATDVEDKQIDEELSSAESLVSDEEKELAKGTQADPEKITSLKEGLRSILDKLTKDIEREDEEFTLLKKQYSKDLKLSRKSVKLTRKLLNGEVNEKKYISQALDALKGSEFESTNLVGQFNDIIDKATKSEEQVAAYSNQISANIKNLVQQSSQRQSISKEITNLIEKADKIINKELSEEKVHEVHGLLSDIREKRNILVSFKDNIGKMDDQKQTLLKNLFQSGANASSLMEKQKDIVTQLDSLVKAALKAKENLKKAKE